MAVAEVLDERPVRQPLRIVVDDEPEITDAELARRDGFECMECWAVFEMTDHDRFECYDHEALRIAGRLIIEYLSDARELPLELADVPHGLKNDMVWRARGMDSDGGAARATFWRRDNPLFGGR